MRFWPGGLIGRAALILVVPITGLMLVVASAVVQRHYDRVIAQLVADFARLVRFIQADLAHAEDPHARLDALALSFNLTEAELVPLGHAPTAEPLPVWELSARLVQKHLAHALPDARALVVTPRAATLALSVDQGERTLVLSVRLDRLTPSNPHQLVVVTLVAALLLTSVSYIFLRNQLRPVRRLAEAAQAFGRGEEAPLAMTGAAEVRAAARAFLEMRERIKAQIESRTLMLSGISHDLRTPLTRMRLALDLLEPGPEVAELARDIAQMEAMIDRYLDFLRDGKAEPESAFDLVALATEQINRPDRAKKIRLVAEQAPITVHARRMLLARALDNLLANALRYGTKAELRLCASQEALVIEVEDNGPGIPLEQREKAVKPFVRLDAARPGDGGVGLGLSIVETAAKAHGGRLELAEGQTPGLGGLCARLILPRRTPEAAAAPARDAKESSDEPKQ